MDAPLQFTPVAKLSIPRWSVSRDMWQVLAHWLVWIAVGVCAVHFDSYYVFNGWWMAVVVFWIDTSTVRPILATDYRLRPVALLLATIAAGVLIYITFNWIASDLSDWRLGGTERWQKLLALPTQSLVASVLIALLLVPPLRHTLCGASVYLLFLAALATGLVNFGTSLISPEYWREHFTGGCIKWFDTLILPLIVTAYAQRLDTAPWPRLRVPGIWLRLWRGEAPLGRVTLVIYPLTLLGTYLLSTSAFADSSNVYARWELALPYAGLQIVYLIIISVGSLITWRTLQLASERGIRSSRVGQAAVILMSSPFVLIFLMGDGFSVGEVFNKSVRVMLGGAYKFELSDENKELVLSGEVTYGLARKLEEQLKAHSSVRRIWLSSDGGTIQEAADAAKVITAHHLNTAVSHECSSACTVMFVAGVNRELAKDGKLGFHNARGVEPFEELRDPWQRAYAPYGVDPAFIARVNRVKPITMWYPTRQELIAAGVLPEP